METRKKIIIGLVMAVCFLAGGYVNGLVNNKTEVRYVYQEVPKEKGHTKEVEPKQMVIHPKETTVVKTSTTEPAPLGVGGTLLVIAGIIGFILFLIFVVPTLLSYIMC